MIKNGLEIRTNKYFKLSSQIAQLDNAQLRAILEDCESSAGWGKNHTIMLGESQVFVKRLPLTNIEYDSQFSTKNLYDLPTYYNYGVGSAGFGVFRELITHIKTTNWVLEGSIANFPLMYHYRMIPISGQQVAVDLALHNSYVEYWGNSAKIANYILDRANANYELVLFLEYIPHVLDTWLSENLDKFQQPLDELRTTIDFLRAQGIIHFDAHFQNILTDGDRIYLTDFGLVLDRSFELTQAEKSFFDLHTFYDYGEILWNLGHPILHIFDRCSETAKRKIMDKYAIQEGFKPFQVRSILLDNIARIHADGDLILADVYVDSIVKYRSIIASIQEFFTDMRDNDRKDTKFPHVQLQLLLEETGFLSGDTSYSR
jgi:serine/threonine protein kinase